MNNIKLVIAEKRSVGVSIAKAIGATSSAEGYMYGNDYIVSWCVGHLIGLADASSYDEKFVKWAVSDLPIIPKDWHYEIFKDKGKQFGILKKLMQDEKVAELICATDAGREGELIFRLVYNMAGCKKPVKRLWISSLENSAILEGFANLHDSSEFDNLFEAASCRAKADWLVGINSTRLFSKIYNKKLLVGRVQTPTLAMLAERDKKIKSFSKEKFFITHITADGLTADSERISDEGVAKQIAEACSNKQAVVELINKERKIENPPKLYDLTTLQREANRYFGFTAQQTLDLVQSLYEKQLLTYPRTDSRYITEDMSDTVKRVLYIVQKSLPLFSGLNVAPNTKRIIDNSKVSDHHAIIPTAEIEKTDIDALPITERQILELVSMQLLCAVSDKHVYDELKVTLSCEGHFFKHYFVASCKTEIQMGWREICEKFKTSLKSNNEDEKLSNASNVFNLSEGDILENIKSSVSEHYTSPPKAFTEDTLLSAMETAGKEDFDDDTEKKGLGTPSTRAGIIEKLVKSGFVERKGRSLIPTEEGSELVKILPKTITSPTMTAEWENALMQIERGKLSGEEFLKNIEDFTKSIVSENKGLSPANAFGDNKEVIGKCPRCGSDVVYSKGRYSCVNRECRFCMWEDSKFFTSKKKKLTKSTATELLKSGRVKLRGCYSEKSGKTYDATVVLDDSGTENVKFKLEFENKKSQEEG